MPLKLYTDGHIALSIVNQLREKKVDNVGHCMIILNIQHIVQVEGKLGGKPHISGTRMSVQQIAILHQSDEWSIGRMVEEFGLTYAQVHAALAYYYDHQADINEQIKEDDALTKKIGKPISELRNRSTN